MMKKFEYTFLLMTAAVVLGGCTLENGQPEIILEAKPSGPQTREKNNENVSKRFEESAKSGENVVRSAVELSEKYAKQSSELSDLKEENKELLKENQELKDNIALLEPKLKQTQKELEAANNLLVEMRVELNNWNNNVLGFRDEMRMAEKAQLETLHRILRILGGEPGHAEEGTDENNSD